MVDILEERIAEDLDELKCIADGVMAALNDLRPDPTAVLVSRQKLALIAALSGNADLIEKVTQATPLTLYWKINNYYVEQKICIDYRTVA